MQTFPAWNKLTLNSNLCMMLWEYQNTERNVNMYTPKNLALPVLIVKKILKVSEYTYHIKSATVVWT